MPIPLGMDALSIKRTRVDEAADDAERVAALNELSSALYEYDCTEAVHVADEAIALATALGDGKARGWALHHRGWALSSMGRLDEALDSQLPHNLIHAELTQKFSDLIRRKPSEQYVKQKIERNFLSTHPSVYFSH